MSNTTKGDEMNTKGKQAWLNNLVAYLKEQSQIVCALNNCTEYNHYCESYAYITEDMSLLDICRSDYFQGSSKPHAAIPLPWHGEAKDLQVEVEDQCFED